MMWLMRKLIKNSDDTSCQTVRQKYILTAGLAGVISNFLLFGVKLGAGLYTGSIAILGDAFNNLSDMASSIVSIVGSKVANRPADREHPYGHGRSEYISGMIVAFLVVLVGFQIGWASWQRIWQPEPVLFNLLTFGLLAGSILIKVWQAFFNREVGKLVHSTALKAAAADALGDVLISSSVLAAFAISRFVHYSIDGIMGVLVAIFIIYMGYKLLKETISPLLGESPDPELVQQIEDEMLGYPDVLGVHDIMIHNYGVGRTIATLHAEFPASRGVVAIHHIVDQAEREIGSRLGLQLLVHVDPVEDETPAAAQRRSVLEALIQEEEVALSMHDFRVLESQGRCTVFFDLVVDGDKMKKQESDGQFLRRVRKRLGQDFPRDKWVIILERKY